MQKKINNLKSEIKKLEEKNFKRLEQAQKDSYKIKKLQRILKVLIPEVCKIKLNGEQVEVLAEYQYYIKQIEREKVKKNGG